MSTPAIIHPNPVCPQCGCKSTAKKGKRRNRLRTLQVYRCTECLHRFTGEPGKNKTYPLRLIFETVSTFNLGHSLRVKDRHECLRSKPRLHTCKPEVMPHPRKGHNPPGGPWPSHVYYCPNLSSVVTDGGSEVLVPLVLRM